MVVQSYLAPTLSVLFTVSKTYGAFPTRREHENWYVMKLTHMYCICVRLDVKFCVLKFSWTVSLMELEQSIQLKNK